MKAIVELFEGSDVPGVLGQSVLAALDGTLGRLACRIDGL
jgi:hypothetical protein